MPYIEQSLRTKMKPSLDVLSEHLHCAGEFNYAITYLMHKHLNKVGVKYTNINEMVGMLTCCLLEFYSIIAAPYEKQKRNENGDIGVSDYLNMMKKDSIY